MSEVCVSTLAAIVLICLLVMLPGCLNAYEAIVATRDEVVSLFPVLLFLVVILLPFIYLNNLFTHKRCKNRQKKYERAIFNARLAVAKFNGIGIIRISVEQCPTLVLA